MAMAAPKPCRSTGCSALVYGGNGYCAKHQDKVVTWQSERTGKGRGGRPWRRVRLFVLNRDGWLCQCEDCRQRLVPLPANEVDHISNKRDKRGRLDDSPQNLRAINSECHKKKTQKEAQEARSGR